MNIGTLVSKIISAAMILGAAGLLYEATVALKREALETQKSGMVSLGAFNRRLMQPHGQKR